MSPTSTLSGKALITGFKGNTHGNIIMDDLDGRTRNAKAQKRHREKQKARVKALEDSVQMLTAQLEDARRQLGQLSYPPGSRMPLGAHSPEFAQVQAENQYLRDENADLRRQLYTMRVTYGGGEGGNPADGLAPSPPLRHGSSHGHQSSRPLTNAVQSAGVEGTSSGASASGGSFGSSIDHYSQTPRGGSRQRVLSSSSAPSTASPYVPSSSTFPTDLRSHSLSNAANSSGSNATSTTANTPTALTQIESRYPVRYEPYSYGHGAPPPHSLPRSQQMYNVEGINHGRGGEGEGMWGPESGPPPFAGAIGYPFHDSPTVQTSESWRQAH
ncbi:hypothetical protein IAT38_008174 [Cryptococcus sp. DSM 104549]